MSKDIKGKPLPAGIIQRPNGIYRGRFQYQQESYTLDNSDLKMLIQELEDLRYEVRHGLKGKGGKITLDAWFDVWLDTHKRRSIKESTQVRYHDFYHRYIAKKIGKRTIAECKPIMLERVVQEMADKDFSTKTIRDVYHILNAMFRYAVQNRLIMFNPCEGVELPKTKTKSKRVLTVEEQGMVLKYAEGKVYENLIKIALGTGMRSGELLGLTWEDVDFQKREINIDKTLVHIKDLETKKYIFKYQTPKTKNSTRIIPMQESVFRAFKRQKIYQKEMQLKNMNWETQEGFTNLVFTTTKGNPVSQSSFRLCLKEIKKEIDEDWKQRAEKEKSFFEPIPHFYPHSFRHTFATRCFEAGIEAKVVQGYLGHYSIAITLDLYTHITNDKAKTEMNKLEELYEQII